MKLRTRRGFQGAFTLVEIIGVVALIAVLAAVMAPRVMLVIRRGKVHATAQAIAGLKTATQNYLSVNTTLPIRYGYGTTNGAVTAGRFDADLVAGGYLEHLFTCPLGAQAFDSTALTERIHVRCLGGHKESEIPEPDTTSSGDDFDLDRDTTTLDTPEEVRVVSAFIPKVRLTDAVALNRLLDGDDNHGTSADLIGRCIYSREADDGTVTVYVYIAHH